VFIYGQVIVTVLGGVRVHVRLITPVLRSNVSTLTDMFCMAVPASIGFVGELNQVLIAAVLDASTVESYKELPTGSVYVLLAVSV
jgi:hypothetical protein